MPLLDGNLSKRLSKALQGSTLHGFEQIAVKGALDAVEKVIKGELKPEDALNWLRHEYGEEAFAMLGK